MFDRTKHVWDTTLQNDTGEVHERKFSAYWDPEKVGLDLIGVSSAAEAFLEVNKARRFAPIESVLVS